jgi:aspartyl/asparaginyl-tRNA synthetase
MIKNIIIGVLIAVILGGGAWYYFIQVDHTPIEKILKNPRAYDGKEITIAGEVTDRTSLLFVKFFKLKDKTGEITVTTKKSLPAVGAKERVKGKVEEAFTIGDQQLLVFVENEGEKSQK